VGKPGATRDRNGLHDHSDKMVAVVNDYSEQQVDRARSYIAVRESQNITRIDENGRPHRASSQSIDEVVSLLNLDNHRIRNTHKEH
jgi:hypothetical protein